MSDQPAGELSMREHLRRARTLARGACMRRSREHYQEMQRLAVLAKRAKRIAAAREYLRAESEKKNVA